ncbi:MAG: helix-turn-helix transcriptional regulator [Actinomycetes bacterium]
MKSAGTLIATAGPVVDDGARSRVARVLHEDGPSTAAVVAARLGLTPTAVRRHLEPLLAEGLVAVRASRVLPGRGRGRPARVFALTDAGRHAFFHAYDDLALHALRYLSAVEGPAAVAGFAQARAEELLGGRRDAMRDLALPERVHEVTAILAGDGYAATVRRAPGGDQICQHHCPVEHVAAEFPELCQAETAAIASVLGTHVQRLATIAHGDGVCTTYVPDRGAGD